MTIRTLTFSLLLLLILFPNLPNVAAANDVERGSGFSITASCKNTGKESVSGVVAKTNDPWMDTQERSIGILNPSETQTVQFTGHVPKDAPLGAHSVQFQCLSRDGTVLAPPSAVSINIVQTQSNAGSTGSCAPYDPICQATCMSIGSETFLNIAGPASSRSPNCAPNNPSDQPNDPCSEEEGLIPFVRLCILDIPYGYGPCIIATAAYGSPMAPEVVHMRMVRDTMIGGTPAGRILRDGFNLWYYSWSPPIAIWISTSDTLRAVFRVLLIPIVVIVNVTEFIFQHLGGGNLAAVTSFLIAAFLSIGTYIALPGALLVGLIQLNKRVTASRRKRT